MDFTRIGLIAIDFYSAFIGIICPLPRFVNDTRTIFNPFKPMIPFQSLVSFLPRNSGIKIPPCTVRF